MSKWRSALHSIDRLGVIQQSIGLKLVANGPPQVFVGELCEITDEQGTLLTQAEVIGFNDGKVDLMPFSNAPIRMGCLVRATHQGIQIPVGQKLLGRIVNALGQPIDDLPSITSCEMTPLYRHAVNPLHRYPITERIHTGIHIIDTLFPLGKGQRIGLFAGSGVGKSVLLGMMSKHIRSDINVIALIGERGREVLDFIQTHLNEQTRQKSVVVVACSDEPALIRKQAAWTATSIAEYFCDQGHSVMLFMDSMTRVAMAQREIGLSLGEPPTARGYTPSVFSSLPRLIERTGLFHHTGSITALYTVLVEGDDFNDPISDTLRSLLDGHIVLTRERAHRGQYPAVDVLQSLSRLEHQLTQPEEQKQIKQIKEIFSLYQQNKALIELGAYQPGHHKPLDEAIRRIGPLETLFTQSVDEILPYPILNQRLREIVQ